MTYSSEVAADSPLAYYRLDAGAFLSAATASSSFSSFEAPAYAFDNSPTTYWTTNGFSSGWLQAQLTAATTETAYAIRRRDDIPNRNPKDWTFEGSNDGSTWTTLDTRTGVTWPTSGELKSFSFTNTTAYLYYRLNVSANNGDTYLSVAELWLSSTCVWDSSGNARLGVFAGSPTFGTTGLLTGSSDTAVTLNGSSQYGSIAYGSWMAANPFTVEALVKPSSVTGTRVIASRQSATTGVWTFRLEGTALKFYHWYGTGGSLTAITASTTFAIGTIYHVAATINGTAVTLYVNGSSVGSGTIAGTPFASTAADLLIGASGGGEYFAGVLDEVALYGTSLSGTRIAAHYAAATARAASGAATLSLAASGGAAAASGGTASLSLSASGDTSAAAGGAASLSLTASGALTPPTRADGAATLALSASGGASGSPGGTASLNLIATGTAFAVLAASGSATLTLTAFGSAVMSAGGTAELTLSAGGVAFALYLTDITNAMNGRGRHSRGTATVDRPAVAPPAGRAFGVRYDKAIAYPTPTMVDGRPT